MNNIALEIKGLKVVFGMHTALSDVNLSIEESSFVSIVGPNGGGKSTLLRTIAGLINPTEGEVCAFGSAPSDMKPGVATYVPQVKTLDRSFPARAIELVASGINGKWVGILNKKDKALCMETMEKVGASHLAERPLSKLSGGELQRIYLAKSIIRQPKLLLLDEPATGIDMLGEKDINHLIDEYKRDSKATIIMVTHDWEAAFHHADKVLLLNCRPVCFETPDKAFKETHLRRTFGHVGHQHDMIFGVHNHD